MWDSCQSAVWLAIILAFGYKNYKCSEEMSRNTLDVKRYCCVKIKKFLLSKAMSENIYGTEAGGNSNTTYSKKIYR